MALIGTWNVAKNIFLCVTKKHVMLPCMHLLTWNVANSIFGYSLGYKNHERNNNSNMVHPHDLPMVLVMQIFWRIYCWDNTRVWRWCIADGTWLKIQGGQIKHHSFLPTHLLIAPWVSVHDKPPESPTTFVFSRNHIKACTNFFVKVFVAKFSDSWRHM